MTEPTDAELLALIEKHLGFKPRRDDMVIDPRTGRFHDVQRYRDLKADILAEWGTPAVAKWAPEEIADGERGIRWVTNEGIHGRPTDHDVREYLKQTPTAHGCHCDECKQFYTTPHPTQAQAGVVPQYRLLQPGVDRIEDDDEFLSDDTTTWAIDPNGIFSGNIYGGHVLRPARRRIKGGRHGAEY